VKERKRRVAIQVVELKTPEARSPFEATDGYSLDGGEAVTADIFDSVEEEEPTPEPKKAVKKKASKPTDDDTDISDIVDEWDD
jgi:hypothetical protein